MNQGVCVYFENSYIRNSELRVGVECFVQIDNVMSGTGTLTLLSLMYNIMNNPYSMMKFCSLNIFSGK